MSQFVRAGRQRRARPVGVLAGVFATLTGACTEPLIIYPNDGGADGASPSPCAKGDESCSEDEVPTIFDAAVGVSPPFDWTGKYRNNYAMRVRRYGTLGSGAQAKRVKIESIFKAIIDPPEAKRTLKTVELCREEMVLASPGAANPITSAVRDSNNYPDFTFKLQGPESDPTSDWTGTKNPTLIGYSPLASACPPGQEIDSQMVHTWLRGQKCLCPSAEASSSDLPPAVQNDCRLFDPDDDGEPGISLQLSGGATGTKAVAILDSSRIVHGRFYSNGKHTAVLEFSADYSELRCASGTCERGKIVGCRKNHNTVDLTQISDGNRGQPEWNCSDIMKELNDKDRPALFPNVPHDFPEGDCN